MHVVTQPMPRLITMCVITSTQIRRWRACITQAIVRKPCAIQCDHGFTRMLSHKWPIGWFRPSAGARGMQSACKCDVTTMWKWVHRNVNRSHIVNDATTEIGNLCIRIRMASPSQLLNSVIVYEHSQVKREHRMLLRLVEPRIQLLFVENACILDSIFWELKSDDHRHSKQFWNQWI